MAQQPRRSLSATPLLVGREREQAALRAMLDSALLGRGSLVLVGGEAGIGKTALAEALCAEAAERGALVLVGRCYDLSETPPYGPWVEALARAPHGGGLPPSPDLGGGVAASQAALFAAVRDYLVALTAGRPLVILLDDLHWTDTASLDLLRVVGRSLAELPLLLLATYRTEEATSRHQLYRLLPLLLREAPTAPLTLPPLAEGDTRALVATRYWLAAADAVRLVGYLHAHAQGNPFYIRELLRSLEDDQAIRPGTTGWVLGDLTQVEVPGLLRQVIGARVARLGEDALRLLALAAVIGQEVPLDLWAAVAGIAEEAMLAIVERAVEARVLADTGTGTTVAFVHALVREALYAGALAPRRRTWHRRVAEALLAPRAGTPAPDPDAVAHHFRQAGDPRAAEWLLAAGERARRAYAWVSSAERYEAALSLLPEGETERRGWLLLRLAALRRFAEPMRALADLDEAERRAAATADAPLAALAVYVRGHLRGLGGEFERGMAELATGADALEALPPEARARLDALAEAVGLVPGGARGLLANWLSLLGRLGEARVVGERVLAASPPTVVPGRTMIPYADAHLGLALAYAWQGDPAAARRVFTRARHLYQAAGHHFNLGIVAADLLKFLVLPYHADNLAWRRRAGDELQEAFGRASGAVAAAFSARRVALPLLLLEGRWEEAEALGHAVDLTADRAPFRSVIAPFLGALARARGQPEAAWHAIHVALPAGPATRPGSTVWLGILALQRLGAALATDAGDRPTARAWLEAHDRWLAWSGAVLGRAEAHLGWAAYHRAAGDFALAYQHAERAMAHASNPRQPLALLAVHRALGELDTAARRFPAARDHLARGLALAEACAAPYERALTLLALAELHAASGHHDEARAASVEARALLAALGAAPALARADALWAALAAASRRLPVRPDELTAREVEILRLYAADLPYRAIAAQLAIAPRTVGTHVSNIYGKTGITSRLAAARYVADHGLA